MSKSTGNLMLAKDFLKAFSGPLLRYILLATHYRMPVNVNQSIIDNAQQELKKIQLALSQLATAIQLKGGNIQTKETPRAPESFLLALADDINTANALTILHQSVKEVNQFLRQKDTDGTILLNRFFTIQAMLAILGLAIKYPILTAEDRQLYQEYLDAKTNQDFTRSDAIRKILNERNIFF
jgi:cysteinyl-tRNA synthetase